jgi:hypothetical protein
VLARPQWFQIDRRHPLANGLVFAGLGRGAHTLQLLDSSGYGNHGTLTSMDPPTDWGFDGTINRWALDLDGTNDRVVHPSPSVSSWTEITLSVWVSMRSFDANFDVVWQGYNNIFAMQFYGSGANLYGNINTTAGLSQSVKAKPASSGWWHCCLQWASGLGSVLRINNVAGTTGTVRSGSMTPTASSFAQAVGSQNTSWAIDAKVCDPMMWNRYLSASELQLLASQDPLYRGLIAPVPRRAYFVFSDETIGELAGAAAHAWTLAGAADADGQIGGSAAHAWTLAGAVTGDGQIAGAASQTWTAAGTLNADGQISGAATQTWTAAGSLAADGQISGAATLTWSCSAPINADGQIAGAAAWTWTAAGTLADDGEIISLISGNADWTWAVAGTIDADGQIAVMAALSLAAAGTIVGDGQILGGASQVWTTSAAPTGDGQIAGAAAQAWTAAGSLAADGQVSGSASQLWASAGQIEADGVLNATAVWGWASAGDGSIEGLLAGAVGWTWSARGGAVNSALVYAVAAAEIYLPSHVGVTVDSVAETGVFVAESIGAIGACR